MHIKSVRLVNFRNYKYKNIEFGSNVNVIYGENAQGKTNILEAIFLCASGRSHRTNKDAELVKFDEKEFYVKVDCIKTDEHKEIEISYEKEHKKKIRINEIPVKKIGNLMGNLYAVIFSPEDLLIIKEGPSERRRFVDITISQLKPSYFYDLQQYSKVLLQRNTLLKEISKNRKLIDTLDIWNKELVDTGTRIIKTRHEFIEKLSVYIEKSHSILAGGKETLCMKYASSIKTNSFDTEKIKEKFTQTLENNLNKELMKQTTISGPQRDDYEIYLNGTSIKQYGSQGQQRTAILSVKLAEMEIMKEDTGEYPVLLLDDVMSELDNSRQQFLLQNMKNIQCFITCTSADFFKHNRLDGIKYYKVKTGDIVAE